MHALERAARNRFEAYAQHRAAAVGRKLEHLVVLRQFRGDAGLPMARCGRILLYAVVLIGLFVAARHLG
jgi:hypothetical protein